MALVHTLPWSCTQMFGHIAVLPLCMSFLVSVGVSNPTSVRQRPLLSLTSNPLLCRSATETLDAEDKFFCDACRGLQEAQKAMRIKALPRVLCLHLKRFKYIEQLDRRDASPAFLRLCMACSATRTRVDSEACLGISCCRLLVVGTFHLVRQGCKTGRMPNSCLQTALPGGSAPTSRPGRHCVTLLVACIRPAQ